MKKTLLNTIKSGIFFNNNKKQVILKMANASTPYETYTEKLSPFGGILSLIKFLDLVKFDEFYYFELRARKILHGKYLFKF